MRNSREVPYTACQWHNLKGEVRMMINYNPESIVNLAIKRFNDEQTGNRSIIVIISEG